MIAQITNVKEHAPVTRGDDIVFPQPYAGIARLFDGRYIVAGRERGRLVMVGGDDIVISSGDPLSLRHNYEKTVCYGIAEHVGQDMLYLLVGEEGSTELWITRIEIMSDNTFRWLPAWDVRLPSVAARNKDYLVKKPVHFTRSYPTNIESILHPMGFLTSLLPLGDNTPWYQMEDKTVLEYGEFHQLGPVLPELHPTIAPVGSRVVVSVPNVQVYQVTVDLCLSYTTTSYTGDKAQWQAYFNSFTNEKFSYGKEHDWWLEFLSQSGVFPTYYHVRVHFRMTFQYPVLLSSLVLIHPDLGMVENITHIGGSLICPASSRAEAGYVQEELSKGLEHEHVDKKNLLNVLVTCAESEINMHLARMNHYVPANPLTWGSTPPPMVGDDRSGYAYQSLIAWWVRSYLPYMRNLDPVAAVRKHSQPLTPTLTSWALEGTLTPQVRAKIERAKTYLDYELQQPMYPWNDIEGIEGGSREVCTDTAMAVTKTRILSGQVVRYFLETRYQGELIGRGLDVYLGKVLRGTTKIVEVTLTNDTRYLHLKNFKISLVPDYEYPYYQYMGLSMDPTGPWTFDIEYSPIPLEPLPTEPPPPGFVHTAINSFKFYVRVESISTIEDPKPVILAITHERTGQ